jgi:hypothetical protein
MLEPGNVVRWLDDKYYTVHGPFSEYRVIIAKIGADPTPGNIWTPRIENLKFIAKSLDDL